MSQTRHDLKTKYGTVACIVTQGDHIYVTNSPESGMRNAFDFVVRGVSYNISAHFYRWKNGTWHLGEESAQEYQRLYQALYMTKRDDFLAKPSDAARKAVYEELNVVVPAWASQSQNTKTFSFAEHQRLERDLERANEERAELTKKLTVIDKTIADIKKQLTKTK